MNTSIDDFNTRISFVTHMPGHKNSKGESAPWVIKSHETGKILSSHKSESEAKNHLQQMHIHGGSELNISEKFSNFSDLNSLIKNS